jgi:S-DNA-T family DNA segregation ATPase FtsK/SpoIIIE
MTAEHEQGESDTMLWTVFVLAPLDGISVPDLMAATGMSRPWIYLRLRDPAEQGHVIQVSRGRWRAVTDDTA